MSRAILFFGLVLFAITCIAQPEIDWQRNYGGSSGDGSRNISSTDDGGYIVVGRTTSSDGQVVGNHGLDDLWVIKLGVSGELEWQVCLGGSEMEYGGDIRQTTDGGFILIGSTDSSDGDVSTSTGTTDIWVVKLTSGGFLDWEHCYGGSGADYGRCLQLLPNGDFLLFGETGSSEIEGYRGDRDLWLARIGPTGELIQQRCYGSTEQDVAGYFASLPDGRLVLFGAVGGNDADVSGNHGAADGWVVALGSDWEISWQICLGGTGYDNAIALCAGPASDVFAALSSNSTDGDVTTNNGGSDYWIVHISSNGAILNEASFGGTENDGPWSIAYQAGFGIYVWGIANSMDGDISSPQGLADAWLLRLDEELGLTWERAFGGSLPDGARGQCFAPDGSLVLVGSSSSTDGDLTGNFGSSDLWVVKLAPEDVGVGEALKGNALSVFPNPANNRIRITWPDLEVISVEVYDACGRRVSSESGALRGLRQFDMGVSDWSDGLYTVSVHHRDGFLSRRFVKH